MADRGNGLPMIRQAVRNGSPGRVLAAAAGYFATAALGIAWAETAERIPVLWPADALLLAVLLRSGRASQPLHILAAIAASLAAYLAFARPLPLAVGFTALNLLEVLVALMLCLWLQVAAQPPSSLAQALRLFLATAGLPPLVVAAAGAGVMVASGEPDFGQPWPVWWASRAVGMLLFLPLFLWLSRDALGRLAERHWAAEALALLIVAAAVTGFAMTRSSPLSLFLILLPLLWAAIRMDSVWLAVNIAVVTLIATTLTVSGKGPLAAAPGLSPAQSVFELQLVLGALSLPKLVISVLLNHERRIRAELAESERPFRSICNSSPARLHAIDETGRILSVSDAWLESMGYARDEVVGRSITDFMPEDSRQGAARQLLGKLADGQQPTARELQLVRKDGEVMDVLFTVMPEPGGPGREAQALVAVTDITARKEAENRRLQALLEETQRSNQELERFAYVTSHDLQEPLRMVSSFCSLLQERYGPSLDGEANEFLGFAVDGAHRMQDLINGLLAYSRVHSKGRTLAPLDSEEALERALSQLRGAIADSGAAVTHDPLPQVMGDETQISQLFQNLIGNAIKFRGEAAPRVHVSAFRCGNAWRFAVRDNGVGIEDRHKERIFQIFQRLHARDAYPGTGIGLAICSRIVERHGGRLWVDSKPGQGSRFCFTLSPVREERHA